MAQKTSAAPLPQNIKWFIIAMLALVGAFIFLWPLLSIIAFAGVMAYCFLGPYRWLARRMKNGTAATVATILSVAVVVVPLTVILILSVVQCVQLINELAASSGSSADTLNSSTQQVVNTVNSALAGLNSGQPVLSSESVTQFVRETLPGLLKAGTSIVIGFVGSIPILLTTVILYSFLVSAFLYNNEKIRETLKSLSPFEPGSSDHFLDRVGNMITGAIKGQFLMGAILGVSSASLMFIIGLGDYFFFFAIIFTLLSMVPLGTGIIVMPLAILAMVTGQFWQGFWVLFLYLVVVCNMDNVLRPKLIPKKARIEPVLIVLATFAGLFHFGFIGVIYGPVITVILLTTLELYSEYRNKSKTNAVTA